MDKPRIIRNKVLRKKVFERDAGVCCVCQVYDPLWQHDHEIPLWQGGKDTLENSTTKCRRHHSAKTATEAGMRAKTDRLRERHKQTIKRREIRA